MSIPGESSWVRRARPLLGTIVEVTADGASEVIEHAFKAVEAVQERMSYHNSTSELTRLNRRASTEWVTVSESLLTVLRCALDLARQSEGAFDPTVAVRLTSLGFLPRVAGSPIASRSATWRDIELDERNSRVRFHRPLRLDLGGIAKGYAVDLAVEVLLTAGVKSGLVNAGGDLRGFGSDHWSIAIRHPREPSVVLATLPLHNTAMATSSGTFSQRRRGNTLITALLDGRDRAPIPVESSASVIAPTAMIADGLTKVALALDREGDLVLSRYQASAFLFDSNGARFVPPLSHAA